MTKLTRKYSKTIQPKLLTFAEKEAARIKLESDIEEFFARDGFIREIPQGESAMSKRFRNWSSNPKSLYLKKSVR